MNTHVFIIGDVINLETLNRISTFGSCSQTCVAYFLPVSNKKGGVGVYIRNNCTFVRCDDLEFNTDLPIEDIWYDSNDVYIIGIIYRHPNSNIVNFVQLLENSIKIINKEKKHLYYVGI